MTAQEVHQGRLQSPFYSRLVALDTINSWHTWKGYTTPDELYCAETEYFAIRNAAGLFDTSPLYKYRIAGPDAERYLEFLETYRATHSQVVPTMFVRMLKLDEAEAQARRQLKESQDQEAIARQRAEQGAVRALPPGPCEEQQRCVGLDR